MTKKVYYWIWGCLMALSLILGISAQFLNTQQVNEDLTLWTIATIFAINPLFYTSLGAIATAKMFPPLNSGLWRKVCLIGGSVLILILLFIAGAELAGHPVQSLFFQIFRQLFKYPGFFLAPGIILTLGVFDE